MKYGLVEYKDEMFYHCTGYHLDNRIKDNNGKMITEIELDGKTYKLDGSGRRKWNEIKYTYIYLFNLRSE